MKRNIILNVFSPDGEVIMKKNKVKNINIGIDLPAKNFVNKNAVGVNFTMEYGKVYFPESLVYERTGPNKCIKLNRYKLKDGTAAEEFLQVILKNKDNQNLYFL